MYSKSNPAILYIIFISEQSHSRYVLVNGTQNQSKASEICADLGGHLPRIKSKKDMEYVATFMKNNKINTTWLDINKVHYSQPTWEDGSSAGMTAHGKYTIYNITIMFTKQAMRYAAGCVTMH